jgi:hypothetical protein
MLLLLLLGLGVEGGWVVKEGGGDALQLCEEDVLM